MISPAHHITKKSAGEIGETADPDFIPDILHGLQTPLAALKALVESLLEDHARDERLSQCKEILARASSFIGNIGRLSEASTFDSWQEPHPVDLTALLTNILDYVRIVADDESIRLTDSLESGVFVLGVEEKLEELIVNILSNSVKYMRPSQKRFIHVLLKKRHDHCVIVVKDNGFGIDDADLDKVFTRFYRPERTSAVAGSGLGLAIAQKITAVHSGKICIGSRANKGTCVVVRLPLFLD